MVMLEEREGRWGSGGVRGGSGEDVSLLQCGGRMDLCSMGNNWPWCFNSRMRNPQLLKNIKRTRVKKKRR